MFKFVLYLEHNVKKFLKKMI